MPKRRTLSDGDLDLEVVSISNGVNEREFATLEVRDTVSGQLRLPLLFTVLVAVGVVLRGDDDTSLVVLEVGDDVSPTLVVVDAQRNNEVFAGVGNETKGTASSTTTHGENMNSVDKTPRSTVGVVPDSLLGDAEECIVVGLVDLGRDGVGGSVGEMVRGVERKGVAGSYAASVAIVVSLLSGVSLEQILRGRGKYLELDTRVRG